MSLGDFLELSDRKRICRIPIGLPGDIELSALASHFLEHPEKNYVVCLLSGVEPCLQFQDSKSTICRSEQDGPK